MKTLRLFILAFLAVVLVATLLPAPVHAAPSAGSSQTVDLAKTKLAKVRLNNRTGGVLRVTFTGPYTYNFSTAERKWTSAAIIQPGKYTITITSSACGGSFTLKRNVKGGTVGLPPMVCR